MRYEDKGPGVKDRRSEALCPVAGEPTGHVSNSHGVVKVVGVAVEEPVPDLSTAGQDKTT